MHRSTRIRSSLLTVPIPDGEQHRNYATPYTSVMGAIAQFANVQIPEALRTRMMHLDPDFEQLTYGDNGARRGRRIAALGAGDFIAFFASLRPTRPVAHNLVYALIGLYFVREVVVANTIPHSRSGENAHTRRLKHSETDVIVRRSRRPADDCDAVFRLVSCAADAIASAPTCSSHGSASCRDGYIQRSAVPPVFLQPDRFLAWFEAQAPELVRANNI